MKKPFWGGQNGDFSFPLGTRNKSTSDLGPCDAKDYFLSSKCPFQRGRSVCYSVMLIINHNQSLTKIFKRCYNQLWKNVQWIIAGSKNFLFANNYATNKEKKRIWSPESTEKFWAEWSSVKRLKKFITCTLTWTKVKNKWNSYREIYSWWSIGWVFPVISDDWLWNLDWFPSLVWGRQ